MNDLGVLADGSSEDTATAVEPSSNPPESPPRVSSSPETSGERLKSAESTTEVEQNGDMEFLDGSDHTADVPQSSASPAAEKPDAVDLNHQETLKMYMEVSKVLDLKVEEMNAPRPSNSLAKPPPPANSLSLIMSYNEMSDDESGDETEKEEDHQPNNFSRLRYEPIATVSSSEDGGDTSDEENTDGGSSANEHQTEPESDAERDTVARATTLPEQPVETAGEGGAKSKDRRKKDLSDPLLLDLLPPIEKLAITVPEEDCMPIGKVYSIVDRLLVVESLPDTPPLMLDSVIFTREGSAIGQIFDIFGQVKRPFYSIRFNAPDEIKTLNVSIGKVVYCAPKTDHTKYVFTHDLLREKGSDASWKNDQETPAECQDFSDDEAERAAKKRGKNVKVEKDVDSPARRKHLSFEQQMNRNNTLRNRAFKRDSQGETRGNWDGGWHNYKKAQQYQPMSCDPPPPPPRQQVQQPCVYGHNPMNLVIRPPCFNPVVERPPPVATFQPSPSAFTMTAPLWARFEPPPTPPPRGFGNYPNSSPPTGNGGHFAGCYDQVQPPPAFALPPFPRFPSSPPSSSSVFQGFAPGSAPHYGGLSHNGYGHPAAPRFTSPAPPLAIQQPSAPNRFLPPSNCLPPPPFATNRFPSYHHKPNNSNSSNNSRIPRLPFSTSNNNHPPLYNHPPF